MLVDLRATIDSMRRAISHAQGNIEQFRHVPQGILLKDVTACLSDIREHAVAAIDMAEQAIKTVGTLIGNEQ